MFLTQHIRDTLGQHGFRITEFKTIDYGHQIRLLEGAIINVYNRPKVLVQGRAIFETPEHLRTRLEYVLPAQITVWQLK